MTLALLSVIAVAALAAALVLLRTRSQLQRELAAANARVAADVERHRARADELAELLEVATAEPGAGRSPGDETPGDLDAATGAGLWHLLLGHITRRWAAVVGVPPENRSMLDGDRDAQLAQALARETERLREEVGVDVELTVPSRASSSLAPLDDEPGDAGSFTEAVAVLVAAVELLGVLATSAQRVTVDVGDDLVVTGEGWFDPAGELAVVCERATAAGVQLDPVEVGDEHVRLVLHQRARQITSA